MNYSGSTNNDKPSYPSATSPENFSKKATPLKQTSNFWFPNIPNIFSRAERDTAADQHLESCTKESKIEKFKNFFMRKNEKQYVYQSETKPGRNSGDLAHDASAYESCDFYPSEQTLNKISILKFQQIRSAKKLKIQERETCINTNPNYADYAPSPRRNLFVKDQKSTFPQFLASCTSKELSSPKSKQAKKDLDFSFSNSMDIEEPLPDVKNHSQFLSLDPNEVTFPKTKAIIISNPSNNIQEIEKSANCEYCNKKFPAQDLSVHISKCEAKLIGCDICGKKLLIEDFALHDFDCIGMSHFAPNFPELANTGYGNLMMMGVTSPIHGHNNFGNGVKDIEHREGGDNDDEDEEENKSNHDDNDSDGGDDEVEDAGHGIQQLLDEFPDTDEDPYNDSGNYSEDMAEGYGYEEYLALDDSLPQHGLTQKEIEKYPESAFTKNNDNNNNCAICLSEYAVGDKIRTLKCKHFYHKTCVDKWLAIRVFCPFCKVDLKEN